MLPKLIKTGLFMLLASAAILPFVAEARRRPRLTRKQLAEKQLRDYYLKLDQRLFGEKDYKSAERLLKKSADDGTMRPLVVSLLAQYHRRMEHDAVSGLRVLAPEVLGKGKAKQWLRNLKNAESKRDAKYSDAVRQAHFERQPKPEEPSGIALPFPHTQMKISESNVDCALEVARCLMDLGHIQQALQVIDSQGKAFESEGRVLSYECLGDLLLKMQMFDKSVKSYQNGLKLLQHLKPTEGFDTWQKLILARLQKKLAQAKRLWDMDRYGAGYIAYRDAEVKRRKEKSYAEAILLYDAIIQKYPKTVYSEAAKCYRIKCLLALAKNKSLPKAARAAIQKMEKRLEEEREFISLAKKHKVPKQSIEEFESTAKGIEKQIAAHKKTPVGKAALTAAKDLARAFVKENQWGLYRGEVLVDLGEFCLLEELDPDAAERYFKQGLLWSRQAPELDRKLSLYEIPSKAQKIAAPPKTSIQQDRWGNVQYNDFAPGQVLNRRSSRWYLGLIQSQLLKYVGFLAFVDGDMKTARSCFEKMGEVDQRIQYLVSKGLPNMKRRLIVRCDDGAFRRATLKDLKCFRDKRRRFIVYLADFYAETEEPVRAGALYEGLLNGEFGKVNREEEAYVRFGLSWILWYDGTFRSIPRKQAAAIKVAQVVFDDRRLQNTRMAPRLLNSLANMIRYSDDKNGIIRSREIFRFVAQEYPNTEDGENALYYFAKRCLYEGQNNEELREEGREALRRLLKKYPDSQWSVLAAKRLEEYSPTKQNK